MEYIAKSKHLRQSPRKIRQVVDIVRGKKVNQATRILSFTNKKAASFILKTLIIDNECFNKLEKLILDGPKYLVPLADGIDKKSFSILLNEPEKLFQVAFSFTIFSTVIFGKQVKFPNFIDFPIYMLDPKLRRRL